MTTLLFKIQCKSRYVQSFISPWGIKVLCNELMGSICEIDFRKQNRPVAECRLLFTSKLYYVGTGFIRWHFYCYSTRQSECVLLNLTNGYRYPDCIYLLQLMCSVYPLKLGESIINIVKIIWKIIRVIRDKLYPNVDSKLQCTTDHFMIIPLPYTP